MEHEKWLPAPGFELTYEVSNLGNVRTLPRSVVSRGGFRKLKPKLLKPWFDGDGYPVVALGAAARAKVHRLVALAFVGNPSGAPDVDHIDANKANPAAANLRWCTKSENAVYLNALGRVAGVRKVDEAKRAAVAKAVAAGEPISRVARAFGVSRSHVRRLARS